MVLPELFPDANAWDGLNFLWTPQYDSILDLKVWMAMLQDKYFSRFPLLWEPFNVIALYEFQR